MEIDSIAVCLIHFVRLHIHQSNLLSASDDSQQVAYNCLLISLTGHVKAQLSLDVLAHLHPPVLAQGYLLEVYYVVSSRSIAVVVELESVAAQSYRSTERTNNYEIFLTFKRGGGNNCTDNCLVQYYHEYLLFTQTRT